MHIVLQVYDVAIDTIMLAFCEDCEAHDGHPKYAPPLLLEALGYAREAHQVQRESAHANGARDQFIHDGHDVA